jgi:dipeptidyl-peptidase III
LTLIVPDRAAEWDDMYYVCWMEMLYGGIKGLQFFDPEKQIWGQAHVWASWVIFEVVRQADASIIQIEFLTDADGKENFNLGFDRSKLRTVGFKAISDFLHKLHVYKSIGDFETAEKFFNGYSLVNETMMKVRKIVIERKSPRRLELQPNLALVHDKVVYKGYTADHAGIVQSYVDRYSEAHVSTMTTLFNEWIPIVLPH